MIRSFLDFIFPPLCKACGERCSTRFLCPDCWAFCEPPDPAERCRHCFEELDSRGNTCSRCRREPRLKAVRAYVFSPESPAHLLGVENPYAMAGFAIHQWIQLEWPLPDAIIPMPDSHSMAIAKAFAHMLELPFVRALRGDCEYKQERLEENGLLLLIDVANSLPKIQKATLALSESFPKRIFLLSLLTYDFSVY